MIEPGKTYLRKSDYEVRDTPLAGARALIARFHYSGGCSNTAVYVHGLFERGGSDCLGVALWLPPIKPSAVRVYPGDFTKVLALSRLVVLPGLPTNAAGFLLSQSIRRITKDGRFKCLVTYADTWRGHDGGIYRATNWEYLGTTDPKPVWLDPATGRMVCAKAKRTRTVKEMEGLGYVKVGSFPKHRYRMILEA